MFLKLIGTSLCAFGCGLDSSTGHFCFLWLNFFGLRFCLYLDSNISSFFFFLIKWASLHCSLNYYMRWCLDADSLGHRQLNPAHWSLCTFIWAYTYRFLCHKDWFLSGLSSSRGYLLELKLFSCIWHLFLRWHVSYEPKIFFWNYINWDIGLLLCIIRELIEILMLSFFENLSWLLLIQ